MCVDDGVGIDDIVLNLCVIVYDGVFKNERVGNFNVRFKYVIRGDDGFFY